MITLSSFHRTLSYNQTWYNSMCLTVPDPRRLEIAIAALAFNAFSASLLQTMPHSTSRTLELLVVPTLVIHPSPFRNTLCPQEVMPRQPESSFASRSHTTPEVVADATTVTHACNGY
eukprot:7261582-Pyramimonas_sp.AAC.1